MLEYTEHVERILSGPCLASNNLRASVQAGPDLELVPGGRNS